MPHGFQGAVLRAFGAKDHELTVRGVTRLAPHFIRVRFDAGTLFRQVAHEPAAWVRLWLHDPVDGNEYQRAYTISDADPDAGWLDIDFLLHEPAGPASAWAAAAEPGRRVIAQFLGSTSYAPVDGAAGLLLIGDAASLPAINAILRAAPADTKIDVLLERDPSGRVRAMGGSLRRRLAGIRRPRVPPSRRAGLGGRRDRLAQGAASRPARAVRHDEADLPRAGLLDRGPRHGHRPQALTSRTPRALRAEKPSGARGTTAGAVSRRDRGFSARATRAGRAVSERMLRPRRLG
jgi:hypothetical protein